MLEAAAEAGGTSFPLSSLSTEQRLVGSVCSGAEILVAPPFSLWPSVLSACPEPHGAEGRRATGREDHRKIISEPS